LGAACSDTYAHHDADTLALTVERRHNMKSKNFVYIAILLLILIVTIIFLTSRLWLPDDRAIAMKDYDITRTVGTYSLRISDAVYDKKTDALTVNLYAMSINPVEDPLTLFVYTDGNKNHELTPTETILDGVNRTITISNMPSDYYFITIEVRTLDKEKNPVSMKTSIDYRTIKRVDTSNIVYITVTPSPTPAPRLDPYTGKPYVTTPTPTP
jgi:hypothetical protein